MGISLEERKMVKLICYLKKEVGLLYSLSLVSAKPDVCSFSLLVAAGKLRKTFSFVYPIECMEMGMVNGR